MGRESVVPLHVQQYRYPAIPQFHIHMLMQTLHNFIAMNMDMLSNTRIQWETSTTNESSININININQSL